MKYLVDTNIFLEVFLQQQNNSQAYKFFDNAQPESIYISKFSFHSILVILNRKNLQTQCLYFLEKFIPDINIVELNNNELIDLQKRVITNTGLDFDDAYQYLCARNHDLQLVSFDKDFDKTDLKRIEPSEILLNNL